MIFFGLKKARQNYDVAIRYRAYELRPAGSPPIPPEYRARIEQARPVFAERMKKSFDVTINSGPFGIDSRPALIIDKFAETQGVGEAYHLAALEAYWQHGRDISDMAVLRDIAARTGLDPAGLDAALQDDAYIAAVDADIEQAQDYGLSGVPALVLDSRYLVMGAQPYETLAKAVERAQADHTTA
jgi:predicted DsbA family dithiol-disulfide isomerase